jgi:hypothetical protein
MKYRISRANSPLPEGEVQTLRGRYSGLIDLEASQVAARTDLEKATQQHRDFESADEQRRSALNREYDHALGKYTDLKSKISLLEENLEDISFGIYKPHFTFQTAEEYKTALEHLRDAERQLIRDGKAAICQVAWTVGNSAKEGARMVKLNEKLLLRAFNGECEADLPRGLSFCGAHPSKNKNSASFRTRCLRRRRCAINSNEPAAELP